MRNAVLIFLGAVVYLFCLSASSYVSAQQPQESSVTLYSVNKHRGKQLKSCVNFKVAPTGSLRAPCDLRYGALYAGDNLDWFESSGAAGHRSVIKDLGEQTWNTYFEVPAVEPLPKLKPGEQRHVTIDTSGADGADGAPGADGDGVVRPRPRPATDQRPKHDGKQKIDPMFVKAVLGHIYVIHVVDDSRDFYVLFRVEALERGDNCTVSWKLIPAPVNQSGPSASR